MAELKPYYGFHERIAPDSPYSYYLLSKEGLRYAEGCKRLALTLSRGGPIPTTVNGFAP